MVYRWLEGYARVLAPDDSCISMEVAATSLTIKWCKRLADAFTAYRTYGIVALRRQDMLTQNLVNMQAMELTVRDLIANTEYELLFDVYTFENPMAAPLKLGI